MKKRIILGIAFCAILSVSCDQSLLDIPQKGVTDETTYYKTDDDCESALAAVYNGFRAAYSGRGSGAAVYGNGFFVKNLLADDFNPGGARSDQTYAQELYESAVTPTNGWVEYYYKSLYSTIYLANLVIEKFDAGESTVKARDIAEAKVLRSICYFELTTLWGTPPLVDRILRTSEEYKVPNSTAGELWAFMEKDLTEAISSGKLTSKSSVDDVDGSARMTLEAAKALLGRAYLFQGKYEQAAQQFAEVIESGKYGLMDGVEGFYHPDFNGCREYIVECVRHYDTSNMYRQGGWYGILANWSFGYGFIAGPESSSHYRFNTTSGYSYFCPSKSLYEAYVAEEGVDGYRVNNWIKTFDQVVAMNIGVNTTRNSYGNEGFWRLKWLASLDDENVAFWCGNQSNTPYLRYDDLLLMMAEACVKTGDQSTADSCVNLVRERAKLAPKNGVTLDEVKLERRLELAMDGIRYQDLIRWGDAPAVLANKGRKLPTCSIVPDSGNDLSSAQGIYNAKYTVTVTYTDNEKSLAGWTSGRDELLPFPENEIEVNENIVQNPGY